MYRLDRCYILYLDIVGIHLLPILIWCWVVRFCFNAYFFLQQDKRVSSSKVIGHKSHERLRIGYLAHFLNFIFRSVEKFRREKNCVNRRLQTFCAAIFYKEKYYVDTKVELTPTSSLVIRSLGNVNRYVLLSVNVSSHYIRHLRKHNLWNKSTIFFGFFTFFLSTCTCGLFILYTFDRTCQCSSLLFIGWK
jgi:hypothetical protein